MTRMVRMASTLFLKEREAARNSLCMKTIGIFGKKSMKRSGSDIAQLLLLMQVIVFGYVRAFVCTCVCARVFVCMYVYVCAREHSTPQTCNKTVPWTVDAYIHNEREATC